MTDTPERSWRDNRIARVVITFASLLLIYIGGMLAISLGGHKLPTDKTTIDAIGVGLTIIVSLWAYVALVHWLERRRPVSELRAGDAPGGLIVGFILGVGILSAAIGTIMLMHDAMIVLDTPPVLPLRIITIAAISGVCEELIFRGALFRITEEMFGTLIALLISGAFFGGAHIVNANATPLSSAAIAIEALVLCFAYTATRSLWLPIGLHAGWNLTEGGIYSTSVSGGPIIKGVFLTTFKGPDIITGGAFGPETSVVTLGVSLVLTIIFAVITFRRGEWKGLRLRIRAA
jgi:membrane protease YdiL (CAAX protease family)